ncbi:LysR family transcriptional regulator [Undibacterium sp. CY18W]|uniref:LysR family transcriptional regulator n=1 Tax=Undibacterium hunanense TaxID=2762292 RepID=A0ABR6ZQB7_9BURK|nr:LysR family transcriptional regulator [Undibacterium hunanense]MBC3918086.1 LysR family transcriptional regulator [Undibacterium hunanense]
MELKRLRHVVALADERNFARAAERVHLSQSALSRSIQAAEAELQVQLFDRGTTEVSPTPAGSFFIERARKLLFDSRCLERDIDLYRKKQIGHLAIGVGPFPAATLLPLLMPELRQQYATVSLRVEVNNWEYLAQHLRSEELDFFVADTRELPPDEDLDIHLLARQPGGFFVRTGHPLLNRPGLQATDIVPYGLASVRLPQAIRQALGQLLGLEAGKPLPIALECDDVLTLKRTALESDTVLAAIYTAVSDEIRRGEMAALVLPGVPTMYSEVGIVSLRGRSHSPVAQFVIARLQALAEMAG